MSLRCLIIGDCRRVALPAFFCLASLISLLFTISYTNDRAMLHEAEIRAETWLRLASRQLGRSPRDIGVILAHAAADTQVDGVEILNLKFLLVVSAKH